MHKGLLVFAALAIGLPTFHAHAHGNSHVENIAGAYVCKNASGTVQRIIGQDTWEADQSSLYPTFYNDAISAEAQVDQMIQRVIPLQPALGKSLAALRSHLKSQTKMVSGNASLTAPTLSSDLEMKGCDLTGLMSYKSDSQVLLIDQDILNGLAHETEKAAAYFHILLSLAMPHDQPDIANVKLINGCLFSSDPIKCLDITRLERPIQFAKDNWTWHCNSDDLKNSFYVSVGKSKYSSQDWNFVVDKIDGLEIVTNNSGGMHWNATESEISEWTMDVGFDEFRAFEYIKTADIAIKSTGKLHNAFNGPFVEGLARLSLKNYPQSITSIGNNKFSCEMISGTPPPYAQQIPKLKPGRYEQVTSKYGALECDAKYLGYDSAKGLFAIQWAQANGAGVITTIPCDRVGKKLYFRQRASHEKGQPTIWKGIDPVTGQETEHTLTLTDSNKNGFIIDEVDYSRN